jgi:glycerol kinase
MYLLGIDQGTSGSKAVIIDDQGNLRGHGHRPLERLYPQPGYVEQDPYAVAQSVSGAITAAVDAAGCAPDQITACGITSQRNTDFAWDKKSGLPIGNAVTWQDLRTAPVLREIEELPFAGEARYRLGYPPGTYMTAVHLVWRMRHQEELRAAAQKGTLRLGLSTAWLLEALGRPSGHAMDTSLVQAMGLYDFRNGAYWQEWLDWIGLPIDALPQATPTLHDFGFLRVEDSTGRSAEIPVRAMIGDQQAALFGHSKRCPGDAECTHGTSSYVKVFLGDQAPDLEKINIYNAWWLAEQQAQTYCLEAPTTVTGAAIRWLRDNARLFDEYEEMDRLAGSVDDSGGVYFVPAFTGLDVPYNNPSARATLLGLTLGHHRGHIARAFFESIGYQIRAILETIDQEAGVSVEQLLVGGGVSASDLACQIQADLTGIPALRPTFSETTAWAVALLAGLGADIWATPDALPPLPGSYKHFDPTLNDRQRDEGYQRWQQAIALVSTWGKNNR